MRFSRISFALAASISFAAASHAAPPGHAAKPVEHWVGTWGAPPMLAPNKDGALLKDDTTLRQTVHVSLGGSTLRVIFTNEFGTDSLTISAASVAPSAGAGAIDPAKAKALTFGGQPTMIVPPGALAVSDPVAMTLPPLSDIMVTMFLPAQPMASITLHSLAMQNNLEAAGNQINVPTLDKTKKFQHFYFLKGIDVMASEDSAAVVTLGDSITDGAQSTVDANHRWPNVLAERLHANKATANIAVLNEGISGNRVLHDQTGPSALARLDRDVLSQSGVKYLIILEGINDIGRFARPDDPTKITADELIQALGQIIERAHSHGIKVYGAPLTSYEGAGYYTPEGEKVREAENEFIRHSGKFDGVIDFDKMTLDPAHPTQFYSAYNGKDGKGDHLHPNDTGYKAMGDGIDLKLFEK